ncbi:Peptidyl-tRNA hydrolase ict1, mitochondrial [Datura stramonium]|uniref:Peptidyl-tRNA hydrolase ict1, mitochondrial n=1 Tax=Datura stramonium TaxID=4076 RepID=A0ABS8SXT4_DATST|nr:Peptidyl-tRNA hydrolase ict1, mitochondrial [Datura stramonium]
MAAILKQTTKIARQILNPKLLSTTSVSGSRSIFPRATVSGGCVRFASTSGFSYLEKKTAPRRLPAVYSYLLQADERTHSTGNEPIPKITLNHVSVSFSGYVDARSHTEDTNKVSTKSKTNKPIKKKGKKGNQKQNTSTPSKARNRSINTAGAKIIMKLDVKNAHWLSERVRERIMLMERSRIKDGELVLTSTKTRKQENNFEDLVAKKQKLLGKFQEIINAASYAPLPPSEGLMKKISKLAVMGNEKSFA